MAHLMIRHKVASFDQWKLVYDAHQSARDEADLKTLHLWCNQDDPSEVFILFEASDIAKARALIGSADLKERMQAAGVQGPPDIAFLTGQ